jgi:hypothetical protein
MKNMKAFFAFLFALAAPIVQTQAQAQTQTQEIEVVTISGRVTDFEGRPIDSCQVWLIRPDFSAACAVFTEADGSYSLPNVVKGKYAGLAAMRVKEYPLPPVVAEEDMRLEYWAWNIIADRDLTINPRYHRLELYGTTVFRAHGGYPGVIIYTRPMSLGAFLSYGKDTDETATQTGTETAEATQKDISASSGDIAFQVWADDVPLAVRSVQPIDEWVGDGEQKAYIIYADLPETKSDRAFCIFRVAAFNRAYGGEWGENAYFYEIPAYK